MSGRIPDAVGSAEPTARIAQQSYPARFGVLANYRDIRRRMAHKLRTHFRETSRLKSGVSWLPCAPPGTAVSNNLWMTCGYPVGRGWTQFLVSGPIPAS